MLLSEILFDVRICADDALVKNSDIGWKELVITLYFEIPDGIGLRLEPHLGQ